MLMNFLESFTTPWQTLLMSMLPIIELRGAIPYGIAMGLPPLEAAGLAILGSMLPVPFLLLFLDPVFFYLRNQPFFRHQIDRYTHRTLKKIERTKTFGTVALVFFVGIPLPGTGVWTGSFAASLMDIDFKRALLAIFLGDLLAALVVTSMSATALSFF